MMLNSMLYSMIY